jgi:hypothetical protein
MGSLRYYQKAAALVQVGQSTAKPVLRDARRLVGVHIDGSRATLFSPQGPLSRDELDLIELVGDSLLLEQLLPASRVRIGDRWKHSPEIMAALLQLEKVTSAEVTSSLAEVTDGTARIQMHGKVQGEDKGALAEVQLWAKYRFDLSAARITWLGLLVEEDRSQGLVTDAFQAVKRIQVKISPDCSPKHLRGAEFEGIPCRPAEELVQLEYESSSGGWQFLNDRRWFVTVDQSDRVVLELVDGQRCVAQCHVSSTAGAESPSHTSLADFQRDAQKALGSRFGRFAQASQTVNDLGYRVFRVVAEGLVDRVPIVWIYYLVADKQGNQVVAAFIVEADQVEHFADADRTLVATLRLAKPKLATRPDRDQPSATQ